VGRGRGAKGARERQQTSPLTRLCVGGWRGRVNDSRRVIRLVSVCREVQGRWGGIEGPRGRVNDSRRVL
jgi:hypothetical protein